jgi:hypothetical protein
VRLSQTRGKTVPEPRVDAPTLPDFLQARLRTLSAPWREEPIVLEDAWRVQQAERAGGLVLWYDSDGMPSPAPLIGTMPETELSEAEPAIRDVAQFALGPKAPPDAHLAADAWQRLLLRAGLSERMVLISGGVAAAALLATAAYDVRALLAFLGVFLGLALCQQMFIGPRWRILPAGVRVGRAWSRNFELFTPETSVMMVRRLRPGWRVTLYDGRRRARKLVSPRELAALLSAWQARGDSVPSPAPIPPP